MTLGKPFDVHPLPTAALLLLGACGADSDVPSATDNALAELQEKYDQLTQNTFDDPAKWATDDIENIGDWEYIVREFASISPVEFEDALNRLGDDRWELFWMERTGNGYVAILKKPAVSYLSKIPLSQIGRLVIGDKDTTE